MRRAIQFVVTIAMGMMLAPAARGQSGSSFSSEANAAIVAGLSITNTVSLDFGDMFAPPAGGTVVVSAAGALSVTGVTHAGGAVSAASFNVNQTQGQPIFYVEVPASITISSGAGTMVVDTFTTNLANPAACVTTGGPAPGPRGQCPKTPFVLSVGATLHIGANQPVGSYTGTFDVTANLF
jgi:Mat/Ecp fimbriae major subunit